jgi:hypothetical protein
MAMVVWQLCLHLHRGRRDGNRVLAVFTSV